MFLAYNYQSGKLTRRLIEILAEVSRIDTYFFHERSHGNGRLRRKMNVGNYRSINSFCAQSVMDSPGMLHIRKTWNRDTDDIRARLIHPFALRHCRILIVSMSVAHGLNCYRIIRSDMHFTCCCCQCLHFLSHILAPLLLSSAFFWSFLSCASTGNANLRK